MSESILEPFASEATRFVTEARSRGQTLAVTDVLHHLGQWARERELVHDLATKKFAVSTFATALLKSP